ncbi:MAG: hypothetical protein HGA45_16380 [Chloroflexales bacterium]|nr:hypothetical protein [Chloroflexales bacterium]
MDQEIDLRPYIQALARQWWLIVGLVMALCVLVVVSTSLSPRQAQARGDLLVIPQSSQLTLDPRFTERDATMVTNSANQRQALIDLASSSALEARVAQALGLSSYRSGELLAKIEVTASSDLIQILASAPTEAEATQLAEAWTQSYEALVNELFSGSNPAAQQIDEQITSAQQRFDVTQTELDSFYASGALVQAQQQAQRLGGLLGGGVEAQVRLYSEYLTRTQELNLILEDARALQAQAKAGAPSDLAASLSSLAVRARLAGAEQLPVQLSFDSAESFAQGQGAADLASFVTVLEGERDRMVGQADVLAKALAAGDGSSVGLPDDLRARYEEELSRARGALARAEGQEALLLQRRTVALSSLQVLQTKRDEGQIAQAAPAVSVRFVGVATVPPRSLVASLVLNLGVAVVAGLFLSIAWIIGREVVRRAGPAASKGRPTPTTGERQADHPISSD